MKSIRLLLRLLDCFSETFGRALSLLTLVMMLVLSLVVILRYGFGIGSIALQESVTYLHATVFMLGIANTLKLDGHVRVDIFYRRFNTRSKAWVNSLGGIVLLLPICVYIVVVSADFVGQSWQILERSSEPGGIPAVFLFKTLIPLMALTLSLQAIADIIRNTLTLIDPEHSNNHG